jgi:hypothetical protein
MAGILGVPCALHEPGELGRSKCTINNLLTSF